MLQKAATHQIFKRLDNISSGVLELTTPDGKTRTFGGQSNDNKRVKLDIYDWR